MLFSHFFNCTLINQKIFSIQDQENVLLYLMYPVKKCHNYFLKSHFDPFQVKQTLNNRDSKHVSKYLCIFSRSGKTLICNSCTHSPSHSVLFFTNSQGKYPICCPEWKRLGFFCLFVFLLCYSWKCGLERANSHVEETLITPNLTAPWRQKMN